MSILNRNFCALSLMKIDSNILCQIIDKKILFQDAVISEMIETLIITMKRTSTVKQGIKDVTDVTHIVLNPQTVVFPGEKMAESTEDIHLSTLEVRTALARIYKQVNKTVPDKLMSLEP